MNRKTFSIAQLKAGLSSIIADVSRGHEIVVTDHNRAVARLVSVNRVPALPRAGVPDIFDAEPFRLKPGSPDSGALIRSIRDDA